MHMGYSLELTKYWGMKTSTNLRVKIIPNIFFDHNGMTLEVYQKKINEKKTYYMETKQHATKNKTKNNGSVRKLKGK